MILDQVFRGYSREVPGLSGASLSFCTSGLPGSCDRSQSESPQFLGPLVRIIDADSGMRTYRSPSHHFPSILEPEGFAGRELRTVETAIDLQRATEPPRSIDQLPIDFDRPDQYG